MITIYLNAGRKVLKLFKKAFSKHCIALACRCFLKNLHKKPMVITITVTLFWVVISIQVG
jgi:hypothetical protein